MSVKSSFPEYPWDGRTGNPWRGELQGDHLDPNQDDWNQIVAELIATQKFVVQLAAAVDKYSAIATEDIFQGAIIRLLSNGGLTLADAGFVEVSGVALSAIPAGQLGDYARRGRIYAQDWTTITGEPDLTVGKTYFLRDLGTIHNEPAIAGFIIPVGQAQAAKVLDFTIGTPIRV